MYGTRGVRLQTNEEEDKQIRESEGEIPTQISSQESQTGETVKNSE